MKNLSLITAGLLAAGLISAEAASTVTVRITGSTAFRNNANAALNANSGGIWTAAPTTIGTAFGAGANQLVFTGTANDGSGNTLIIKTSWTGSEAGIAALTDTAISNPSAAGAANLPGTPKPFYLDTATGLVTSGDTTSETDIAMADTGLSVSLTGGLGAVDQGIVGIVQFTWMKSKNNSQNGWADLKNITIPVAHVLLASAAQDLSFVTGNPNDFFTPTPTLVGVVGRNKGSGTRVNTLIEDLYGVTVGVNQYAMSPTYDNNNILVVPSATGGSATAWTDAGWTAIHNDGFDSGKGVQQTLLMTGTGHNIAVGYIGMSDANGVQALISDHSFPNTAADTTTGTQYLSLNGNYYSDLGIQNGSYDFWGHEHILTGPHTQGIASTLVLPKLKAALIAACAGGTTGFPYTTGSTIFVDRPGGGDTGFVSPL
jgi:hypothetical protein